MELLEVSGAVRHIYIYVIRRIKVNMWLCHSMNAQFGRLVKSISSVREIYMYYIYVYIECEPR